MRKPSTLALVRDTSTNREVVDVLRELLRKAESGALNGIIFGVQLHDAQGQKYYCDAAGTLHRNPIAALGVAAMLGLDLERRMRLNAEDCDV
jgi:hypothetical protein